MAIDRNHILPGLVTFLLLSAAAAHGQTATAPQLIRDVRVYDGERVLEHRSVSLEDGKISRIGGPELQIANAEVVDGQGRTLLPQRCSRSIRSCTLQFNEPLCVDST